MATAIEVSINQQGSAPAEPFFVFYLLGRDSGGTIPATR